MPTSQTQMHYLIAAGVLFYSIYNGHPTFLLGKEKEKTRRKDSNKWADFGGKVEEKDANISQTAAREAYEETMGVVMSQEDLLNLLENNMATLCIDIRLGLKNIFYRMYLVRISFQDYGTQMQKLDCFLNHFNIQIMVAEKSELRWFSYEELLFLSKNCSKQQQQHYNNNNNIDRSAFRLRPNFARSFEVISSLIDLTKLF